MIDLQRFENNVVHWAAERSILRHSTPQAQMLKLVSEMGELADNLAKGRDTKDDIGDCMVVLAIISAMQGYNLKTCAEVAWNDIKDRKGTMSKEGVFVKESDNE